MRTVPAPPPFHRAMPEYPYWVLRWKGMRMTIYSQHRNRGKIQILATFDGPIGVTSSTVTSVDTSAVAEPIVNALNRISALATAPIIELDERERGYRPYPTDHLAVLVDRQTRAELLHGEHSLWYEFIRLSLHRALGDLDEALSVVPAPVSKAVEAELESEARALREAAAESEGNLSSAESDRRLDSQAPLVIAASSLDPQHADVREALNNYEEGISLSQRRLSIADLRALFDAHSRSIGTSARLDAQMLQIETDLGCENKHWLSVLAPEPGEDEPREWRLEISRWEPEDPDESDGIETSVGVLTAISSKPTVLEIADIMNRVHQRPGELVEWSKTPAGEALAGTVFIVR